MFRGQVPATEDHRLLLDSSGDSGIMACLCGLPAITAQRLPIGLGKSDYRKVHPDLISDGGEFIGHANAQGQVSTITPQDITASQAIAPHLER